MYVKSGYGLFYALDDYLIGSLIHHSIFITEKIVFTFKTAVIIG